MSHRILSLSLFVAVLLASTSVFAASDLQKVEWSDAGNAKELVKTYPFIEKVIEDIRYVSGESDPVGNSTSLVTARIDLKNKNSFLFVQIQDELHCGVAAGCGTIIYADTGKGFSIAKEMQLPGDIYAGLCGDDPAIAVQLNEFMATDETFKVFHLKDGKLEDGPNFSKLEGVDLCATE